MPPLESCILVKHYDVFDNIILAVSIDSRTHLYFLLVIVH